MPGGYGTLDEFTEALNLIQTHRISKFPVIVFDRQYWKGMLDWLKSEVLKNGNISPNDLNIIKVADSPKEVVSIIKRFYEPRSS